MLILICHLLLQVNTEQCNEGQCITDINCCLSSTPCYNGGTCIPSPSQDQRFVCKCRPGFKGKFCEKRIITCGDYDENQIPGKYTIVDKNGNPYQVFCDFSRNNGNSWTLIQSYSLENKKAYANPFTKNMPRNEDKFLWSDYRLSFERMAYIHEHSLKWRITCNYDTERVRYDQDFVRASTAGLSLFTLLTDEGQCVSVQRITITGYFCNNCRAHMIQSEELPLHFNGVKSIACGFNDFPNNGTTFCNDSETQEDYFGYYNCTNPVHKCSSSSSSTTQTWLGTSG